MKRTFLRIGTNAAFCILLLVMLVVSFNCIESPLEPIAPSSDIVLGGVSVFDKTFYYREVEVKAQGTVINSDSTMSYITTQYSQPQNIDSMKLQMNPSGHKVGVGVFSIAALPMTSQSATLSQLGLTPQDYPGAGSLGGGLPPPFPQYYVSLRGDTLNYTNQFDYAAINSGTLSLRIVNNLPLKIVFNRPIIIRNNQLSPFLDNSIIATFNPSGLDSNAIYDSTVSLAGKILRGQMKLDSLSFATQERSSSFSLKSVNGLSVQFSSSTLTADSAVAVIPSQTLQSIEDSSVVMDDTVIVERATFSAGTFDLRIVNNLGMDVGANFVINELLNINDRTSFTINTVINGKQTETIPVNANQWTMEPAPSTLGTRLTYSVGIRTIDSRGQKRPITKFDTLSASLIPGSNLIIKSVTGKIKTQIIPINSVSASGLDFKDLRNLTVSSVQFKNVQLDLRFPMTGGYPMDYDITVVAKLKGRPVDSLILKSGTGRFTRIYPINPVIPLSDADHFDDFISRFIPIAPDSFYIHGFVTLNPDFANPATDSYSTYDTSKIYPEYNIDFPCSIGMTNGILRDTVAFTKDVVKKEFTKAVVSGKLSFNFVNAIPLKMSFSADFLGNYSALNPHGQVLLTIAPTAPFDTIRAAQVDTSGYSISPAISKVVIDLNGDQMDKFNKADSLAIRFGMTTSNNGQVVKVRAYDYIRVYVKGDITYTVNKP